MNQNGTVYLIPSVLDESGYGSMPDYLMDALEKCNVIFAENERTARRFIKQLWKSPLNKRAEFIIDEREWFTIHKAEDQVMLSFTELLKSGKTIGIISEAGCPGIADPGQVLVAAAQQIGATVRPLVGPSSILLALMASGLNGQSFQFVGYLPIDNSERAKTLKELETESMRKDLTQIFIETPYRNNQILDTILKTCKPSTLLCVASDLTGPTETIRTRPVAQWKNSVPELHKRPVIFLLLANGK